MTEPGAGGRGKVDRPALVPVKNRSSTMNRIDSRHARRRISQRGICEKTLSILLERGDREVDVGKGCLAISLSRDARRGLPGAMADRVRNLVAIVSGERLVTVLHAYRRGSHYRKERG